MGGERGEEKKWNRCRGTSNIVGEAGMIPSESGSQAA